MQLCRNAQEAAAFTCIVMKGMKGVGAKNDGRTHLAANPLLRSVQGAPKIDASFQNVKDLRIGMTVEPYALPRSQILLAYREGIRAVFTLDLPGQMDTCDVEALSLSGSELTSTISCGNMFR